MENLEQFQQQGNIPPKSSSRKKYLLFGIIIIFLFLIFTGSFIYWQFAEFQGERGTQEQEIEVSQGNILGEEEDKTAAWGTYVSEGGNYEIKYPSDFSIFSELATQSEDKISIIQEGEVSFESFSLHVFKKDYLTVEKVTFQEYLDATKQSLGEQGEFEENEVTVEEESGIQMILRDWTSCPNDKENMRCRYLVTSWMKDGNLYILAGTVYGEDNFDTFLEHSDQILSSFRFVGEEELDWRSYWKMYKSEKHGFEIKYPQEYSLDDKNEDFVVFKSSYTFTISVLQNPKNYTLERFYEFYGLPENRELSKQETGKSVYDYFKNSYHIESIEANEISSRKFMLGSHSVISIPHGTTIIELTTDIPTAQAETLNRMLSTFKFLR